jgi:hypothetical protein
MSIPHGVMVQIMDMDGVLLYYTLGNLGNVFLSVLRLRCLQMKDPNFKTSCLHSLSEAIGNSRQSESDSRLVRGICDKHFDISIRKCSCPSHQG